MEGPKIQRLYFTLKQVSEISGIRPHIVREWEKKFSRLKPQKSKTGRKLFKKQDLDLILFIKKMKQFGISDDGIRSILKNKWRRNSEDFIQGFDESELRKTAILNGIQRDLIAIRRLVSCD